MELVLGFLMMVVVRLGKRTTDEVADAMYSFAKKGIVDAYKRLGEAVSEGDATEIKAASANYKTAILDDPDAAEVIIETIATVQRVDPFAVMCAVTDEMFTVLTAADYRGTPEPPPGCGAFSGSFSNPELLTVVDFRYADGVPHSPHSSDDHLFFAGLSDDSYSARMWILKPKAGEAVVELETKLNKLLRDSRNPVHRLLIKNHLDEHAERVWTVKSMGADTIDIDYLDPELDSALKAAGEDIAAGVRARMLDTEATRLKKREEALFYVDDSSGTRALLGSILRVADQRKTAISAKNEDWQQVLSMLFPQQSGNTDDM